MARLLLAAAVTLLAAAARAETLDCRNIERGHREPAVLDFSQWKWHATALASRWMQCYLKEHLALVAVTVGGPHGLHGDAIERSQSAFEAHRGEFEGMAKAAPAARRAALKGWKVEALKAASDLVAKEDAATRPAQLAMEAEKAAAEQGLRESLGDRNEPAGEMPRFETEITVTAEAPIVSLEETPRESALELQALPTASPRPEPSADLASIPSEPTVESSGFALPRVTATGVAPPAQEREVPSVAASKPPGGPLLPKPSASAGAIAVPQDMRATIYDMRDAVKDGQVRSGVRLPRPVEEQLIAIGMLESSGLAGANGDDGKAYGRFQMHRAAAEQAGCTRAQWQAGDSACAVRFANIIHRDLSRRYGPDWHVEHPSWLGLNWNLGQTGFRNLMNGALVKARMAAQYYGGKWGLENWERRVFVALHAEKK